MYVILFCDGPREGQVVTVDGDAQERQAALVEAVVCGPLGGYELFPMVETFDQGKRVTWVAAALELTAHQCYTRLLLERRGKPCLDGPVTPA